MLEPTQSASSYLDRLRTFDDYWTDARATARQLAAIGHVADRPPLESIEEGSRCISCSHFVAKDTSVLILEGDVNPEKFDTLDVPEFHRAGCIRLQVRLPFEQPQWFIDSSSMHGSFKARVSRFETQSRQEQAEASSGSTRFKARFFSLPTEIRLQIYQQILPACESTTEIVQVDRDSMRITTAQALHRPRAHDPTQSSILRVCHTTYHEVLDLIFSHRTFVFASSKLLYMFLRRIGRPGRSLLRSIDCTFGQREDAVTFALLSTCDALEHVSLHLGRQELMLAYAPLWVEDGVACLLDINGLRGVEYASKGNLLAQGNSHDAVVVRRELTRERGSPCMVATMNGRLVI